MISGGFFVGFFFCFFFCRASVLTFLIPKIFSISLWFAFCDLEGRNFVLFQVSKLRH